MQQKTSIQQLMPAMTDASGSAYTFHTRMVNQKAEAIGTGALMARSSRQKRNLLKQSKTYNYEQT